MSCILNRYFAIAKKLQGNWILMIVDEPSKKCPFLLPFFLIGRGAIHRLVVLPTGTCVMNNPHFFVVRCVFL